MPNLVGMGHDLSNVRVAEDRGGAAIGAEAFTQAANLHFGGGHQQVLGHEAHHVVQQAHGNPFVGQY
ncbi:MAG: DUF4157 domain-containing protein [Kofleriaceae bacterium]